MITPTRRHSRLTEVQCVTSSAAAPETRFGARGSRARESALGPKSLTSKVTVGEFLERWLGHIKSQVTPKSYERYSGLVNQNIKPAIGAVLLAKLRSVQISEAYTAALANGRRDGKQGGLSPRTVGHMHRVRKQALSQAVKWELLTRNPADAVDPPKVEWKPVSTYDLPQMAEIIEFLRGRSVFMPVLLAALCGLRRGEICALRWRHVDLDAAQLSIVESLEQTKAGLRFKSPKRERDARWRCRQRCWRNCVPTGLKRHKTF
jgi:integrase